MATHHPYADHDQTADQDYRDHVESYRAFLFGIRTSIAIAAVILALMAYFLLA
ncbi:MAG TPA: aa3-type cytochrome c oxidase subunit IV [Hyphomicrobium sp.]|nr:aa3-type cytochrome c oxidase subunit IV [Hyphomicrobium sp.]